MNWNGIIWLRSSVFHWLHVQFATIAYDGIYTGKIVPSERENPYL